MDTSKEVKKYFADAAMDGEEEEWQSVKPVRKPRRVPSTDPQSAPLSQAPNQSYSDGNAEPDAEEQWKTLKSTQEQRSMKFANARPAPVQTPNQIQNNSDWEADDQINAHLPERFGSRPGPSLQQYVQPSAGRSHANQVASIRRYFQDADAAFAAATFDWQKRLEIPSSEEIMAYHVGASEQNTKTSPMGNNINGPYDSKEHYLRTQYELLRDDSVLPLRESVGKVRGNPWAKEQEFEGDNIGIYENVHITALTFAVQGLGVRVVFSLGRIGKRVNWEQSKRLRSGTLVALTPSNDMFRTECIVAVVAARPLADLEKNPPELHLYFARTYEVEIDPSITWVMVEHKSSYFEGQRYTLCALQKLLTEPFPLAEHLVDLKEDVDAPAYVQARPDTDLSPIFRTTAQRSYDRVDILRDWPKVGPASSGLDKTQQAALERMLTKRLAIIQGPPGTGKTHVSVCALKILLAQSNMRVGDPPIIVTCQTNHALDQLLRHIAEFEPHFVRLGGQSKDYEVVRPRTLYELKQREKNNQISGGYKGPARREMKTYSKAMQDILAPLRADGRLLPHPVLRDFGLLTEAQFDSLERGDDGWVRHGNDENTDPMERWLEGQLTLAQTSITPDDFAFEYEEPDLEFEQLKEMEAENAIDDEDFEKIWGYRMELSDEWVGKTGVGRKHDDAMVLKQLQERNLWKIHPKVRGAIYNYLSKQLKLKLLTRFRAQNAKYHEAVRKWKIGKYEEELLILKSQKVIGMTTTGFSKFRPLVAALKPKIIMLEEAAEILEGPVAATCIPSLEHLILVGDHKQLRPNCQVQRYQDHPYYLNMSLFERMVGNQVEFQMLRQQRRMIPEIRALLHPIYGDLIKDHPDMEDASYRPPIPGMAYKSFFFTHQWPEAFDPQSSAFNSKEADMIVGFFFYLVLNGFPIDKITVLTFYNGQRKQILKKLRDNASMKGEHFKVKTVDSYQGEENDIVLLSMVRSNDQGTIGFLRTDNRVCVALSRARRGFYLFGNADQLAGGSRTWKEVTNILSSSERLAGALPITCSQHENEVLVQEPSDWKELDGGCIEKCTTRLECGHTCQLRCHPYPHESKPCTQPCIRSLECGHKCGGFCCDKCRCRQCSVSKAELETPQAGPNFMHTMSHDASSEASAASSCHDFANGGHAEADWTAAWKLQKQVEEQEKQRLDSHEVEEMSNQMARGLFVNRTRGRSSAPPAPTTVHRNPSATSFNKTRGRPSASPAPLARADNVATDQRNTSATSFHRTRGRSSASPAAPQASNAATAQRNASATGFKPTNKSKKSKKAPPNLLDAFGCG